jgi:hypothetical protein
MMTCVKLADAAAKEGYTEIFRNFLNLKGCGNVLEDRTRKHVEVSEPRSRAMEMLARDLRVPAEGVQVAASSVSARGSQSLMEKDALTEMLDEMSLSSLLYYVLAEEGMEKDEPS